ncbi:MAG: hypothetical protein K0R75_2172 [Paenibacillaceae bacterium]|jgi:hypothetical protein|nr:hypothetical protein [Paenibacillaceae bacterium]
MNCQEVMELMQRSLDNDLKAEENNTMQQHLLHCSDCAAMYVRLQRLSRDLEALPKVKPPFSIVDSILPQLEQLELIHKEEGAASEPGVLAAHLGTVIPEAVARKRRFSKLSWGWVGGVVAAGLVLGVFITNQQPNVKHADELLMKSAAESAAPLADRAASPEAKRAASSQAADSAAQSAASGGANAAAGGGAAATAPTQASALAAVPQAPAAAAQDAEPAQPGARGMSDAATASVSSGATPPQAVAAASPAAKQKAEPAAGSGSGEASNMTVLHVQDHYGAPTDTAQGGTAAATESAPAPSSQATNESPGAGSAAQPGTPAGNIQGAEQAAPPQAWPPPQSLLSAAASEPPLSNAPMAFAVPSAAADGSTGVTSGTAAKSAAAPSAGTNAAGDSGSDAIASGGSATGNAPSGATATGGSAGGSAGFAASAAVPSADSAPGATAPTPSASASIATSTATAESTSPATELKSPGGTLEAVVDNSRVVIKQTADGKTVYTSFMQWQKDARITLLSWNGDSELTYEVQLATGAKLFVISVANQTETSQKH